MNTGGTQIQSWMREFLFNKRLYVPTVISFEFAKALLADDLLLDGHCPYCQKTSTFCRNLGDESVASVKSLLAANESRVFNLNCTRDTTHNIFFLFRFGGNCIEKVGQYPPFARVADYRCETKYPKRSGREFWRAATYLSVVLILGCILELNESATGRAALDRQQQNAQGTRVADRVEAIGKELQALNLSVSYHDDLIAATVTRLDKQEAALESSVDACNTRSSEIVPHLGIEVAFITVEAARAIGLTKRHGLIVAGVDPGSPAERAGVQKLDLILKVDDAAVTNPKQMRETLLSLRGKHAVVLTLERDGKKHSIQLNT